MRTPFIAGNWKMNTTAAEAVALVQALRQRLEGLQDIEVAVCPPFISLIPVSGALRGSSILLGAQNMHFQDRGAYTGEISPPMLAGICQYVILGHSERRQYFGEDDETVHRKVEAALKAELRPILCVGENLEQRERGATEAIVTGQLRGALEGLPWSETLVIAYEPVWAIGTGRAATGPQANQTIGGIRRELARLYTEEQAQATRILYGGSVTPDNVAEFAAQAEIDGALVGGASLRAEDFAAIVARTQEAKRVG